LRAVGIAAVGLTWPKAFGDKRSAAKPNVLFIVIDDLNHWIGCMRGYPNLRTPNMDRLAARGAMFSNAHCSAPSCNPSRASLLTGILPSTSGVDGNTQVWRWAPKLKDAVTLPGYFRSNGYRVGGAGKIFHIGGEHDQDPRSWHEFYEKDMPISGKENAKDWKVKGMFWGPSDVDDEDMPDSKVVAWTIRQLEREHDRPFFLACGISKPHLNWEVPRKYFDMHPIEKVKLPKVLKDDLSDIPVAGRRHTFNNVYDSIISSDNWKDVVQAYLACISFVDAPVGRLIDALDASGYAENTIICFWSDHGWHLGQKEHFKKFVLWEEATNAPFFIIAPGVTRRRQRCARPVSFIDIYPTLVDLCGLPAKDGLEGRSLVPLLRNPERQWDRPALTTHEQNCHALRSARWRYIRYPDGSEELYDHFRDELEWHNLAGDPKYASLKKELAEWLPRVNADSAPSTKDKKKESKT
jgi:arylsulfatase A-like enzyme